MATVRIYLPTHRRPALLPRALASLRAQTFTDWTCELHNDDPTDPAPGRLLAQFPDSRITLVTHECNLGGTATFNLFFRPCAEPFYSMLEDDNWWEPDFLAQMLATAKENPEVILFWANMRLWQEQPNGSFLDTGRMIWPDETTPTRRFAWGQPSQAGGALHSNGAALVRSVAGQTWTIPPVPFAVVEPFRERMMPHPLLLVTRPLAHFSITRQSTRSRNPMEWAELQAMLLATFFRNCPWPEGQVARFWAEARAQTPPATTPLILAALMESDSPIGLRHARWSDWWIVVRGFLRRPHSYFHFRNSRRNHPDWWSFLERHTASRWQESAAQTASAS
jgi:hypothetical protein